MMTMIIIVIIIVIIANTHCVLTRYQDLCYAFPFYKLIYEILERGYDFYLHFTNENAEWQCS